MKNALRLIALLWALQPATLFAQFGITTVTLSETTPTNQQQTEASIRLVHDRVVELDVINHTGQPNVLDYVAVITDLNAALARLQAPKVQWWIDSIRDHGLTPIIRIDGNPNDPAAWATFAQAVATRFGSAVKYYQVGNEVEQWARGPVGTATSQQYVNATEMVANAIHTANATAEVWANFAQLGSFFPVVSPECALATGDERTYGFAANALRQGLLNYVQRVSYHEYHGTSIPEKAIPACAGTPFFNTTISYQMDRVREVIGLNLSPAQMLDDEGQAGWFNLPSTEAGHCLYWTPGDANAKYVSQMRRLLRMGISALARGNTPYFWYTLVLRNSDPLGNQENTFGIMADLNTPRPAFTALARMHALFNDAAPIWDQLIPTAASADQRYVFKTPRSTRLYVWWTTGTETVASWPASLRGTVTELGTGNTYPVGRTVPVTFTPVVVEVKLGR